MPNCCVKGCKSKVILKKDRETDDFQPPQWDERITYHQ